MKFWNTIFFKTIRKHIILLLVIVILSFAIVGVREGLTPPDHKDRDQRPKSQQPPQPKPKPVVWFLTFDIEPTSAIVERLKNQITDMGIFDDVRTVFSTDLKNDIWWSTHGSFIELNTYRWYGYFVWKPEIIKRTLNQMPENSILVYCDPFISTLSKNSVLANIDVCQENELMYTLSTKTEEQYAKMDTLKYLGLDTNTDIRTSFMRQAGYIYLKNTANIRDFVSAWSDACVANNYHFIDGTPSSCKNADTFIEAKNVESIFSLLSKKRNIPPLIKDPSSGIIYDSSSNIINETNFIGLTKYFNY